MGNLLQRVRSFLRKNKQKNKQKKNKQVKCSNRPPVLQLTSPTSQK